MTSFKVASESKTNKIVGSKSSIKSILLKYYRNPPKYGKLQQPGIASREPTYR